MTHTTTFEPRIICIEEVDSTNSELHRMLEQNPSLPSGTTITTRTQTAGRGQRGNHWESAPEKNITLSFLLRPEGIDVSNQFTVCEAVSLAVLDLVQALLHGHHEPVAVKWPNDIYVGDRKISGTLIETALEGRQLKYVIAGIGLNVNQQVFVSDAPNPVSIHQLTGRDHLLTVLETALVENILRRTSALDNPETRRSIHEEYLSRLWRRNGFHNYRLQADGSVFEAEIDTVDTAGPIVLRRRDGSLSTHCFKEIHQLL